MLRLWTTTALAPLCRRGCASGGRLHVRAALSALADAQTETDAAAEAAAAGNAEPEAQAEPAAVKTERYTERRRRAVRYATDGMPTLRLPTPRWRRAVSATRTEAVEEAETARELRRFMHALDLCLPVERWGSLMEDLRDRRTGYVASTLRGMPGQLVTRPLGHVQSEEPASLPHRALDADPRWDPKGVVEIAEGTEHMDAAKRELHSRMMRAAMSGKTDTDLGQLDPMRWVDSEQEKINTEENLAQARAMALAATDVIAKATAESAGGEEGGDDASNGNNSSVVDHSGDADTNGGEGHGLSETARALAAASAAPEVAEVFLESMEELAQDFVDPETFFEEDKMTVVPDLQNRMIGTLYVRRLHERHRQIDRQYTKGKDDSPTRTHEMGLIQQEDVLARLLHLHPTNVVGSLIAPQPQPHAGGAAATTAASTATATATATASDPAQRRQRHGATTPALRSAPHGLPQPPTEVREALQAIMAAEITSLARSFGIDIAPASASSTDGSKDQAHTPKEWRDLRGRVSVMPGHERGVESLFAMMYGETPSGAPLAKLQRRFPDTDFTSMAVLVPDTTDEGGDIADSSAVRTQFANSTTSSAIGALRSRIDRGRESNKESGESSINSSGSGGDNNNNNNSSSSSSSSSSQSSANPEALLQDKATVAAEHLAELAWWTSAIVPWQQYRGVSKHKHRTESGGEKKHRFKIRSAVRSPPVALSPPVAKFLTHVLDMDVRVDMDSTPLGLVVGSAIGLLNDLGEYGKGHAESVDRAGGEGGSAGAGVDDDNDTLATYVRAADAGGSFLRHGGGSGAVDAHGAPELGYSGDDATTSSYFARIPQTPNQTEDVGSAVRVARLAQRLRSQTSPASATTDATAGADGAGAEGSSSSGGGSSGSGVDEKRDIRLSATTAASLQNTMDTLLGAGWSDTAFHFFAPSASAAPPRDMDALNPERHADACCRDPRTLMDQTATRDVNVVAWMPHVLLFHCMELLYDSEANRLAAHRDMEGHVPQAREAMLEGMPLGGNWGDVVEDSRWYDDPVQKDKDRFWMPDKSPDKLPVGADDLDEHGMSAEDEIARRRDERYGDDGSEMNDVDDYTGFGDRGRSDSDGDAGSDFGDAADDSAYSSDGGAASRSMTDRMWDTARPLLDRYAADTVQPMSVSDPLKQEARDQLADACLRTARTNVRLIYSIYGLANRQEDLSDSEVDYLNSVAEDARDVTELLLQFADELQNMPPERSAVSWDDLAMAAADNRRPTHNVDHFMRHLTQVDVRPRAQPRGSEGAGDDSPQTSQTARDEYDMSMPSELAHMPADGSLELTEEQERAVWAHFSDEVQRDMGRFSTRRSLEKKDGDPRVWGSVTAAVNAEHALETWNPVSRSVAQQLARHVYIESNDDADFGPLPANPKVEEQFRLFDQDRAFLSALRREYTMAPRSKREEAAAIAERFDLDMRALQGDTRGVGRPSTSDKDDDDDDALLQRVYELAARRAREESAIPSQWLRVEHDFAQLDTATQLRGPAGWTATGVHMASRLRSATRTPDKFAAARRVGRR